MKNRNTAFTEIEYTELKMLGQIVTCWVCDGEHSAPIVTPLGKTMGCTECGGAGELISTTENPTYRNWQHCRPFWKSRMVDGPA